MAFKECPHHGDHDNSQCAGNKYKLEQVTCEKCGHVATYCEKSGLWCKVKNENENSDYDDILDTVSPCSAYTKGTSWLVPNPFYVAKKKCACKKKNTLRKKLSLIIVENAFFDEIELEKERNKGNKPSKSKWSSFAPEETRRRKKSMERCKNMYVLRSRHSAYSQALNDPISEEKSNTSMHEELEECEQCHAKPVSEVSERSSRKRKDCAHSSSHGEISCREERNKQESDNVSVPRVKCHEQEKDPRQYRESRNSTRFRSPTPENSQFCGHKCQRCNFFNNRPPRRHEPRQVQPQDTRFSEPDTRTAQREYIITETKSPTISENCQNNEGAQKKVIGTLKIKQSYPSIHNCETTGEKEYNFNENKNSKGARERVVYEIDVCPSPSPQKTNRIPQKDRHSRTVEEFEKYCNNCIKNYGEKQSKPRDEHSRKRSSNQQPIETHKNEQIENNKRKSRVEPIQSTKLEPQIYREILDVEDLHKQAECKQCEIAKKIKNDMSKKQKPKKSHDKETCQCCDSDPKPKPKLREERTSRVPSPAPAAEQNCNCLRCTETRLKSGQNKRRAVESLEKPSTSRKARETSKNKQYCVNFQDEPKIRVKSGNDNVDKNLTSKQDTPEISKSNIGRQSTGSNKKKSCSIDCPPLLPVSKPNIIEQLKHELLENLKATEYAEFCRNYHMNYPYGCCSHQSGQQQSYSLNQCQQQHIQPSYCQDFAANNYYAPTQIPDQAQNYFQPLGAQEYHPIGQPLQPSYCQDFNQNTLGAEYYQHQGVQSTNYCTESQYQDQAHCCCQTENYPSNCQQQPQASSWNISSWNGNQQQTPYQNNYNLDQSYICCTNCCNRTAATPITQQPQMQYYDNRQGSCTEKCNCCSLGQDNTTCKSANGENCQIINSDQQEQSTTPSSQQSTIEKVDFDNETKILGTSIVLALCRQHQNQQTAENQPSNTNTKE